jgi:hypothetical protein
MKKTIRDAGMTIVQEPYSMTGHAVLRLNIQKPKGGYEEILIKMNVYDVMCVRSQMAKLAASYKKHAQELAEKLG